MSKTVSNQNSLFALYNANYTTSYTMHYTMQIMNFFRKPERDPFWN